MEGGLDSPLSPDPSPCPSYEHPSHSDHAEYEDRHCDHDGDGDDDGIDHRHRRTQESIHEKNKPTTASWGLSTPTPRGPRGRRGAPPLTSTDDDSNGDDDGQYHRGDENQLEDSPSNGANRALSLALTPVQSKQSTPHTPTINSHASDNHHHHNHNHNNNHSNNNHHHNNRNPYIGKDHNPFSNQREGGRTSLSRNGGVLSPVTPSVEHPTHRGSGSGSGSNGTTGPTACVGAIDSPALAASDHSPGHSAAYNHTLTTLVNNSYGDGVELSPVVLRQQTKTDKLRRIRPRDRDNYNHTPINVPVATTIAGRSIHSQNITLSQNTPRRLGPNNHSSLREPDEGDGRGIRTGGLDGMAKMYSKGMGEPRGRPKGQGKATRPQSVTRISRTIAISSNFGVKNYRTAARKKKKHGVSAFVANGPVLESIPESQELEFCDD